MQRFLDNLGFYQIYLIGILPLLFILLLTSGCATAGADSAGRTRDFATTAATFPFDSLSACTASFGGDNRSR